MSGTPYFQQSSCIQFLFRRIFRVVIAGKEVDGCRYEIGASCHGDNPGRSLGPPGPRLPGHANSIRIQDWKHEAGRVTQAVGAGCHGYGWRWPWQPGGANQERASPAERGPIESAHQGVRKGCHRERISDDFEGGRAEGNKKPSKKETEKIFPTCSLKIDFSSFVDVGRFSSFFFLSSFFLLSFFLSSFFLLLSSVWFTSQSLGLCSCALFFPLSFFFTFFLSFSTVSFFFFLYIFCLSLFFFFSFLFHLISPPPQKKSGWKQQQIQLKDWKIPLN